MDGRLLFAGLNCLDCKGFKQLLDTQSLVDCTLACEGGKISAHKLVLSACSSYLAKILLDHPVDHPIIILPELNIEDVKTLVHYMYTGELLKSTTINSMSLLKTAAILSINSLNDLLLSSSSASPNALMSSFNQFTNATNSHNISNSILNPSALMQFQQQDRMSIVDQISPLLAAISQQTQQQQQQSNSSTSFGGNSTGGLSLNQSDDLGRNLSTSSHDSNSSSNSSNLSNMMNAASTNNPSMACNSAAVAQFYNSLTGAANAANLTSSSSSSASPPPSLNGKNSFNSTEPFPYLSSITGLVTVSGSNISSNSSNGSQTSTAGVSSNEFQFKCPVCENHFQTICSFEYHMQRVHSVTSFGCEICNKPFASLRYVLTDHMRRCHGGWKGASTSTAIGQSSGKTSDQDNSEQKQYSC